MRKTKVSLYEDEQTHYRNYLKKVKYDENDKFIRVSYNNSKHGWGRVQAERSLSGSLFHRPTRHSIFQEKYLDFDIVNCQIQILLEFAKKVGMTDLEGLETYCRNPKGIRKDIAEYYGLREIRTEDGVIITPYEQAKKLPIRLAFGGGISRWKNEFNVPRMPDLPLVVKIEKALRKICLLIVEANPDLKDDLEDNPEFQVKSDDEKNRSVMGLFAQTWERIIQEECVAYLVRNFKSVQLRDIISSQDGMMVLKKQVEGIDLDLLFRCFNQLIKSKFDLDIKWIVKDFDEAINIPLSKNVPIDVSLEDLDKGERFIAELIAPAFQDRMKFWEVDKEKCWYILNSKNIWVKQPKADKYDVIKHLQNYIDEEKERVWKLYKKEQSEDKKKALANRNKHSGNTTTRSANQVIQRSW